MYIKFYAGIGLVLSILVVSAGTALIFRGDSMISKPTLDTINNSIGIISGLFTIYTTWTSIGTLADGTLGVGTGLYPSAIILR